MTNPSPRASIASIGDSIYPLIAGHINLAFRRLTSASGTTRDASYFRIITGESHPFGNFACMTDPARLDATRAAIEPLCRVPAPSAALFTGPVSEDVEQCLADAGFEKHGEMPAMAVDIDRMAETSLPEGYTLERVHETSKRDAWADVFARGYELPPRLGAAFACGVDGDARADAPLQCFWIRKGKTPVATSAMYLDRGVAGIYSVATLPEERGKGLGAHVTAQPLREARRLGYRVGVLQSSEAGRPVYKRLGFVEFDGLPLYVRMPA